MDQQTLAKSVVFSGVGVHTGRFTQIELFPAAPNTGIVFIHINYPDEPIEIGKIVPLSAMHATVLRQRSWMLSTVEHLMASLRMVGLDNVQIKVQGEEIPILDGSAAPFLHAFQRAGIVAQGVSKKFLTPLQPLEFKEKEGKNILLRPLQSADRVGTFKCSYKASFQHGLLGDRYRQEVIDLAIFKNTIAPARTFGFIEQLPFLRKHQLAMGSSLGNTLVFTAEEEINSSRIAEEWLNHKILDFIGDLGLLPYPFTGAVEAAQTGHAFNRFIIEHYLTHPEGWAIKEC